MQRPETTDHAGSTIVIINYLIILGVPYFKCIPGPPGQITKGPD